MRILVTGHHGYIGSVLAPYLAEAGHDVTGLDTGFYRGCDFGAETGAVAGRIEDVRDVTPDDLAGLDAIVHLAARPAARLGLTDRGRVAPGLVADLVLFDPGTVLDRATYDDPRVLPAGIPWVFVAGEPVIANGVRTASRPGVALRRHARRDIASRSPG